MGPELQYQFAINRAAELQEEAATYRLARQARAERKASHQHSGHRRLRAAFGKLRTS